MYCACGKMCSGLIPPYAIAALKLLTISSDSGAYFHVRGLINSAKASASISRAFANALCRPPAAETCAPKKYFPDTLLVATDYAVAAVVVATETLGKRFDFLAAGLVVLTVVVTASTDKLRPLVRNCIGILSSFAVLTVEGFESRVECFDSICHNAIMGR